MSSTNAESAAPGNTAAPEVPIKVAFIGQAVFFAQCLPTQEVPGFVFAFHDFRAGKNPGPLRQWLESWAPDVLVMFRPEIVPPATFHGLRAVRIGYLTEPLPRGEARTAHPDLRQRLNWLKEMDPANFDLIVSYDPLIAATASEVFPVWQSQPLPVADFLFGEPQTVHGDEPVLLIGRPTPARERWLAQLRPHREIRHIGHGLHGEALAKVLKNNPIHINLHNNPYPTFENRVAIALAAGQLVISEPLSPDHGLRHEKELVIVDDPAELPALSERLRDEPQHFSALSRAGRAAAEQFRASVVFKRLVEEALACRQPLT